MEDILLTTEMPREGDYPTRRLLLRRLVDVVALPSSSGGLQDRAIAGDLLLELLIDADEDSRRVCAKRLSGSREAPRRVLRYLASDVPAVSTVLLEDCMGFDQSDLVNAVRTGGPHHRLAIAGRRDVGPCVSDAIVESGDVPAMEKMLANRQAEISDFAVDRLVSESRDRELLTSLLLKRPELRPAHALVIFWWSDRAARKDIFQRFSAERNSLIDACSEIFSLAAEEKWSDPVVRKGLQVIERRQRNRAALDRSEHDSLEDLIAVSLKEGMTSARIDELSHLCGVKPLTGAKIFSDPGGEGIAVLAKAVGLKRQYFKALWASLGRTISRPNAPDANFEEVLEFYEMIAVAKAQTVVRYWNWSLSAAFAPEVLREEASDIGGEDRAEGHTRRSMKLVFGR